MNNFEKIESLKKISKYIRTTTLEIILNAKNGHIGGNMSSVELLTSLYFGGYFCFDPEDSKNENRDRVLIRGHLGPLRYTIFSLLGYIEPQELTTYRKLGSRLQGHEDMFQVPGVDITPSGSLGMLLSYGVGSAIANKDKNNNARTIVFLGDGEEQEGNVSEAARHATTLGLNNLICIIDQNKKQLSRTTQESDGHNIKDIWTGYGWDVIEIENGHDIEEILNAYEKLQTINTPTLVIAKTIKGYGVKGAEKHFCGYHTYHVVPNKELVKESYQKLKQDIEEESLSYEYISKLALSLLKKPDKYESTGRDVDNSVFDIRNYDSGLNIETAHDDYINQMKAKIKSNEHKPFIYWITPDLFRKDDVEILEFDEFARFIDTGIREQHAVAMAHGISIENPYARICIYYGDAFVYRALDQINAAATGNSNIMIVGENPGLYGGKNGKTHQSVGQPGALMMIPELQFYEPADSVDLYNVFSEIFTKNKGVNYVRYHRGTIKINRDKMDKNNTGAYFIYNPSQTPDAVIISSGVLGQNALIAAEQLTTKYGVATNVINVVNHKKFGEYVSNLITNNSPILTIYNGNPKVLSNTVLQAIMFNNDVPKPEVIKSIGFESGTSGTFDELIELYNLDSEGIIKNILDMVNYPQKEEKFENGR